MKSIAMPPVSHEAPFHQAVRHPTRPVRTFRANTPRVFTVEMRVEELARRAGIRVDTVRYYQSRGLLPLPVEAAGWRCTTRSTCDAWSGCAPCRPRASPSRRSPGCSPASSMLPTRHSSGALAGEVLSNAGGDLLDLETLAERTGVPAQILLAVEQEGLLVPRRVGDSEGYTEDDVAVARAGLVLLEWGLPLSELLDLAHAHDQAMRAVAERAVGLFDTYVRIVWRRAGRRSQGPQARRGIRGVASRHRHSRQPPLHPCASVSRARPHRARREPDRATSGQGLRRARCGQMKAASPDRRTGPLTMVRGPRDRSSSEEKRKGRWCGRCSIRSPPATTL